MSRDRREEHARYIAEKEAAGPPTPTRHEQAWLNVGAQADFVDVGLRPLLQALWACGLVTRQSCELHERSRKVWIEFETSASAEIFLSGAVGNDRGFGSDYHNVTRAGDPEQRPGQLLSGGRDSVDAWEIHATIVDASLPNAKLPAFQMRVSVLFPAKLLQTVTERWQRLAEAGVWRNVVP